MSVKLRERKYRKGKRLYLDVYAGPNDRTAQFLDIWILPSDTAKERNEKKQQARAIRNRVEADLEGQKYKDVLPKFRKETNFLTYADHYATVYKNHDLRNVNAAINHFRNFLQQRGIKSLSMGAFTEGIAHNFIEYLKKESGLKASTPLGYYQKLNGVVKAAIRDKYMLRNPFEHIDKKGLNKDGVPKEVLNNQELEQLFNTPCSNEYIRRAFIIACYTGMGEAEIRNLIWSDINIKNERITYRRLKTETIATNHLHPMIQQQLFGLDRKSGFVFENLLPRSTNGINKVLQTWVKHAGIDKRITFYCARHTFGTSVCRVSGNQRVVAQAMGHKSTRYTDRYTKIVEEEHIKAVSGLPSFQSQVG